MRTMNFSGYVRSRRIRSEKRRSGRKGLLNKPTNMKS